MDGPELGNVPFIFFSVLDGSPWLWKKTALSLPPIQVPTIHMTCPWVSWLGCQQGLHYTEPLSLFRKKEILSVPAEICSTFKRRRVEPLDGFTGILLDGTFALFFLTHCYSLSFTLLEWIYYGGGAVPQHMHGGAVRGHFFYSVAPRTELRFLERRQVLAFF